MKSEEIGDIVYNIGWAEDDRVVNNITIIADAIAAALQAAIDLEDQQILELVEFMRDTLRDNTIECMNEAHNTRNWNSDWKSAADAYAEVTAQRDRLVEVTKWERQVREFIAFSHEDGKCHIYGDDGELQCSNFGRHGKFLDFKRDPIPELLEHIMLIRMKEHADALAAIKEKP